MFEMIKRLFKFGGTEKGPNKPYSPEDTPTKADDTEHSRDEGQSIPGVAESMAGRGAMQTAEQPAKQSETEAVLKNAADKPKR